MSYQGQSGTDSVSADHSQQGAQDNSVYDTGCALTDADSNFSVNHAACIAAYCAFDTPAQSCAECCDDTDY